MRKKSIIIMIIILLIIGVLIILTHKNSKYIIPDNYIKKIEKHMSYLDGTDEDIYVYNDKIIVGEIHIFLLVNIHILILKLLRFIKELMIQKK